MFTASTMPKMQYLHKSDVLNALNVVGVRLMWIRLKHR